MLCRKFAEDVFVLICAEGSEFFNRDKIQFDELHGKELITRERGNPTRELIEQVIAEQNILIHLIEFNNIDIIKAEVIKKHGIAIMARRLLVQELQRRLLRAIPIADLKKKRSFYVLSPAFPAMIALILAKKLVIALFYVESRSNSVEI